MADKLHALKDNDTWIIQSLPSGKKLIGCKWVFKIKRWVDGTVERYKALLVAKGFTLVEGVDFHEIFALVAKLVTVHCLLTIVVAKQGEMHQLNVNNTFLHGDLDEEAEADHSLFTFSHGSVFLVVLVYVNDMILVANDSVSCTHFKNYLNQCFHIKDLDPLSYFLGMEIICSSSSLFLNRQKYTLDILTEAGMLGSRPAYFPMEQQHQLSNDSGDPVSDPDQYRRLLYLTITRPELSYHVHTLSQFLYDPR
ncbi:hypothetical protein CRG98_014178 [Punica granatum]|uniref:Reverse transcriptase Ty1/copia-type domain-containing protein n=1 Tax=Punica granatum TaxID=22663 RepID=A0A2I0KA60_PUNGR|nr:hypothetical protein CRG98_014178 [Punica granatum]